MPGNPQGAKDFLNLRTSTQIDNNEDSNLTLDLFKRYRFDNGPRKPSFLEQSFLPGISHDLTPPSSSNDKGTKTQLTIFYNGEINVYNDVPYEKAKAIMLLAGESSLSTTIAEKLPKVDAKKAAYSQQNSTSLCELQADLPIARKFSLRRFLEKRRERLSSNAPYASSITSDNNNENEKLQIRPFLLSPFPSRFGNSFTVSK